MRKLKLHGIMKGERKKNKKRAKQTLLFLMKASFVLSTVYHIYGGSSRLQERRQGEKKKKLKRTKNGGKEGRGRMGMQSIQVYPQLSTQNNTNPRPSSLQDKGQARGG